MPGDPRRAAGATGATTGVRMPTHHRDTLPAGRDPDGVRAHAMIGHGLPVGEAHRMSDADVARFHDRCHTEGEKYR